MNEPLEIILVVGWIGFAVGMAFGAVIAHASWRNGVTDGYGYAREPENPGYARAGSYLQENMAHRWPELEEGEGEP